MQITVLAPKTSIKAKLKRISSTNDQIELTKKQVASKSKAIAKSKTSVKLKSPESPTKVKPVKNKRVRVIKASSIKSKSVVSETSSVTQIQVKSHKKHSLNISKEPEKDEEVELSAEIQSSSKPKESDTTEVKFQLKTSSDQKRAVDSSDIFIISKSHLLEEDPSKCICALRRLKVNKMMKQNRRQTRKNAKRNLTELNDAIKSPAKTGSKISKSKSMSSPLVKIASRKSTRKKPGESHKEGNQEL